jgi:uncharacterized protein (TIGR02301 family)
MDRRLRHFLRLSLGILWLAAASMAFAPVAEAQFFNWFNSEPAPRPRVRPKPPGDDLPPIVPRESTAPPPPDDRPYDGKLMRLAEILGAVHYLRELCGAQEGQLWRDQMKEILKNEGTTAVRRAKLVNSFNDGYRGYRRTYRTCTQSATLATTRFSTEGATIAASLAQGSTFASKTSNDAKPAEAASPEGNKDGTPPPEAGKEGNTPDASAPTGSVEKKEDNPPEGNHKKRHGSASAAAARDQNANTPEAAPANDNGNNAGASQAPKTEELPDQGF